MHIDKDLSENHILEAAVSVRAKIIVSGDRDLLSLGEFRGIKILSPQEFVGEMR